MNNYFFIDGSALLSDIHQIQREVKNCRDKKLVIPALIQCFMLYQELHKGGYKRFVFYFPNGDRTTVAKFIHLPKPTEPNTHDVYVKLCGEKLKKSEAYSRWLENEVPKRYLQYCTKSEKGVDIQICCDALELAFLGKLDRLFLYTNDRDFIPMISSLKRFGVNISMFRLSERVSMNKKLASEFDSLIVIPDKFVMCLDKTAEILHWRNGFRSIHDGYLFEP